MNDDWRIHAACLGEPADTFYVEQHSAAERARRICDGCAVKAECLSYALEFGDIYGIWGGLTYRERRRVRLGQPAITPVGRPRKPIEHGTARGYLQHRRQGLEPCQSCRDAHALECRYRNEERRGVAS